MTFGPYQDGHCFYIEKSRSYSAIKDHVQIGEFILLRANSAGSSTLWVVEAKSSSPRPTTFPNFGEFITEIKEKLLNAFSLGWACCLRRHSQAATDLPEAFKDLDLSQLDVKFILVIRGHSEAWLPPIQDALSGALRATVKTWAFSPTSVAVLNDDLARVHGLIHAKHEVAP